MYFAIGNKYPIDTPEMIKMATEYIGKFMSRFPYRDRMAAAVNIEKRAAQLKVAINDAWVTNYARAMKKNAALSPEFAQSIAKRIELCKTAKIMVPLTETKKTPGDVVLEKIAADSKNLPAIVTFKILEEFDKAASLDRYYDSRIDDPAMAVFGHSHNAEYDAVKLAGEATNYDIKRGITDSNKMEKVASVFGKNFAQEFSENPMKRIESMQDPEKVLIGKIIKG